MSRPPRPQVLIVGGGFAGLAAAKALAGAPVDVTWSTAATTTSSSRCSTRSRPPRCRRRTSARRSARSCAARRTVRSLLAEVTGVDVARRHLILAGGRVPYDYLVLAAGATHAYFGHDDWAAIAPGLKSIEDATELRRRILLAFESAEYEGSDEARRAALTFGIVGGGADRRRARRRDQGDRRPDAARATTSTSTRARPASSSSRAASACCPRSRRSSSARAQRDLERMGVEVRLELGRDRRSRRRASTSATSSSRCATSSGPPACRRARSDGRSACRSTAPGA